MAATALLLAGCGGDGGSAAAPTPEASEGTSATPQPVTLAETCPKVEAELPDESASLTDWRNYWNELGAMSDEGDAETQNAIDVLRPAVDDMATAVSSRKVLDARSSLNSALNTMADRCAAVGSSALQ